MRSNIVFFVLILLLAGSAGGMLLRDRDSHTAPSAPTPTATATASASAASVSPSASGSAAPIPKPKKTASAKAPAGPKLGRPLRVVSLGWELLAPGIMSNDGLHPGSKRSQFGKQGVEVALNAFHDVDKLENALARGGEDKKGADVAIMPLQRFVASYERLKALKPVIFYVTAWSDGGEVIMSKHDSFNKLPAKGEVHLRATAGEPAAFLGLFALDLAGVSPERIKLEASGEHPWSATTRRKSKAKSEQVSGNLLLTTAEASRLVPIVAIAQSALVDEHSLALTALVKGWLGGHQAVATNATDAARKIGEIKGAPEPLAVLSRLGEISAASLAENAEVAGLSGRGAVSLETLFRHSWQIWRDAKVLSIPPERAPVDARIIASLIRSGDELTAPPSAPSSKEQPKTDGNPLLTHRPSTDMAPKAKLDEEQLIERIGLLAGVFRRSPLRVSVHPRVAVDKKLTKSIIERTTERFGLAVDKLVEGSARPKARTVATIEVMPVP